MSLYDYFTPVTGLVGGSLIGLSAATLLILNGDILGASGILTSALTTPIKTFQDTKQFWKMILISSFLFTSTYLLGAEYVVDKASVKDSSVPIPSGLAYILGGLLVGFGTTLGNGCTSGHGVCGLGRRSLRSLTGVMAFMASAILTVTLTSPDSSLAEYTKPLRAAQTFAIDATMGARFTTAVIFMTLLHYRLNRKKFGPEDKSKFFAGSISGALFSAGLAISQMVLGSKLYRFLNFALIPAGKWDPTLATVLGAAVPVSMLAYEFVRGFSMVNTCKTLSKPVCAPKFSVPTNSTIDKHLVFGTAIFGVGWGLSLLCPGPALYHAAVGNEAVLFRWIPAFVTGSYAALKVKERSCKV
jgi:hypothetical protein